MVVSERSLRRLRDFLSNSIKVKYRFASLESFHEEANQLEIAEFYEANSEKLLFFLIECYLLMIGKSWVIEGGAEINEKVTFNFAFGSALLDEDYDDQVDKLMTVCKKISPTNSESQGKWLYSLRKDVEIEKFLKFPVVFSKLLQYVSIGKMLSSTLAPILVGMIKRLLHVDNLVVLRVEGLKMLLNLLKAASHEPNHSITKQCTEIFAALVDVKALGGLEKDVVFVSLSEGIPLVAADLSEFEGPSGGADLEMLNEIFSFMTWDLNPDLHSTRFLYNLLRDQFLSKLFPIAAGKENLSQMQSHDEGVRGVILELVVDYLALWFLKSGTRTFKFGSSLLASAETLSSKNQIQSSSMVSMAVNDLSNFLGVGAKQQSSRGSMPSSPSLGKDHKNECPIASFLLEEVILGSRKDVIFIHFILKSACYCLSYASHLFSIKLTLEIFRSWLFNPVARRPQFLQDTIELDSFISFYLISIEGLFPHKHSRPVDTESYEDIQITLVDRVDVYREAVYFFRAVGLQAFFSLSLDRWIQLIDLQIVVLDLLLSPDNLLERPYFTTEDALLAETLLGSLLRSSEHFVKEEEMRVKWMEASKVLTKCSGCRGVIEEWCRVIEALALLVVRDPRYNVKGNDHNTLASPVIAVTGSLSSSGTLPPTTSSFSAWPDLPTVKINAVILFRNMLRILGDPAGGLHEVRTSRPDLMALAYEAMERCLDILIRCRMDQAVKIEAKSVPPLGDFLPVALSALLHLKSYASITKRKNNNDGVPLVAHDASRIIAWRMVGLIMFRPMDLVISDHYWGALLVAMRECFNEPISAAEFTSLMQNVGIPVSTGSVPGTTVILTEMIDGMLRFFNDTLWSGNSAFAFSASEARILIPVSMKIIGNVLKLAKMFPSRFGHFRDESCLLRLIKMFVGSISDEQLLTTIHTSLADIYCSECCQDTRNQSFEDGFAQSVLELMLDGPMQLSKGKIHCHVVICLSEYLSTLAYLKVSDSSNEIINGLYIINRLVEVIEIGCRSEEYSSALVRIIQGPLSDWIIYALQGNLQGDLRQKICGLVDLNFVSKTVKLAIDQFAVKLLNFSRAYPLETAKEQQNLPMMTLLNLALTPSQTLFTFESDGKAIFVTARNSTGKFRWKLQDTWDLERGNCEDSVALSLGFGAVCDDSEFKFPSEQSEDVLKELLSCMKDEHPEALRRQQPFFDEVNLDENWREQLEFEKEFKGETFTIEKAERFERKRPMFTGGRLSIQLRLLLSSLSLTLPELYSGLEILKSSSGTGSVGLDEEFKALDEISGKTRVRIGTIFVPPGTSDENELLTSNDALSCDSEDYGDFLDGLVGEGNKFENSLLEFQVDDLETLKKKDSDSVKKYLGNDSVLVVWHDSSDTLVERAPLRSDVTAAIIRIRPHGLIPGWYIVTLQTCYEKLMQPRKYARVRVDPFTLQEIDFDLDLEVDGIFFGVAGESVQRSGILVAKGALGSIVRALACSAWRQANLINCIRSAVTTTSNVSNLNYKLTAQIRVKYSPESVRRERIEEIIKRHGMGELSYDQYISNLFQQ